MSNQLQSITLSLRDQSEALITDSDNPLSNLQQKFVEKIYRSTEELRHAHELLIEMPVSEVASALNHDVRNLITPIMGYVELLEMQAFGELTELQSLRLHQMSHSANQLRDELENWLSNVRNQKKLPDGASSPA